MAPQPPTPTPPPIATPIPTTPAHTPIKEQRYGGTLNLVSRESTIHQDVHQEVSPALSTWGPGIAYSRLMRFKSGRDIDLPSLAVGCDVCESWTMEDERTFVFRLRDDVRWHDVSPVDARRLTAEDIVYSYNRQRQNGWPNAPLLHGIRSLEAPQEDTLRISLVAPDADFLIALADGHTKIVAREAVEVSGDLKSGTTIGSGPWILQNTHADGPHTFARNPDYFELSEIGAPFVEKLIINVIPDPTAREAAFRTRVTDIQQMEPKMWEEFHQQEPNAPFLLTRDTGAGLEVAFNASVWPLDDVRVRQAALYAMDPWRAIGELWKGFAFVSLGFRMTESGWSLEDQELAQSFGSPDSSRELLREAGAPNPLPVSIKVGDFGQAYLAHAERIAAEMEAVGFKPVIELVNRRVFGQDVWLGGDYQMFVGPPAPVVAPNGYLLPVLHSQGRWNTTGHRDDELDGLLEAQAQEYDPQVRKELIHQIQKRVLKNAYRFMPATRISIWTWQPRVQDFHPNFAGFEYYHWARVWVRGQ